MFFRDRISASIFTLLLLFIMSCGGATIKYQMDPDLSDLRKLSKGGVNIYLQVVDSRPTSAEYPLDFSAVSGPQNESTRLREILLEQLKKDGFKIINNPLLADLSLSVELLTLQLSTKPSVFDRVFLAKSEVKLTVTKQNDVWAKIYKVSREQTVANPATNADASGIINQVLTEQFSLFFTDPALLDFINKPR